MRQSRKTGFLAALAIAALSGGCAVAPSTAPTTMMPPGRTDTMTSNGAAPSSPADTGSVAVTRWLCRSEQEERVLELRTGRAGCDLRYTRGGQTRSIATSRAGDAHCYSVHEKTRSNLERSGYRCERVVE
jgi:hypothetical protein